VFAALRAPGAPAVAGTIGGGAGAAAVGLSLCFGLVVGFSLGLTGGGGSIFAVPLLVYGLGASPREAVGVSLAAVGATALFGMVQRLRAGEVEVRTGLIFSAGGVLGAPAGSWLGSLVPPGVLLVLFAGLMVLVAARMWRKAARSPAEASAIRADAGAPGRDERGPACRRDPSGRLRMSSRCATLLALVGLGTGVLSGLFGVGGGFVIVPALVFFSGMGIHRAVATSLLAIGLISASGVASYLAAGRPLPPDVTGLFVLGGVGGMWLGTRLGRRLSGPRLQKTFAAAMALVAAYIVARSAL
jgi:uncharacterized membrane protein YfcA